MLNGRRALLALILLAACKEEAGPRPQPGAEEACRREPEPSLAEFCDQSRADRELCDRYAAHDDALQDSLEDCADTGFPLAIGACDLRVIDRSHPTGSARFYYDEDGELAGVRWSTDRVFTCPSGSPREQSVTVQLAGRVDESCDPCLVCGAVFGSEEPEVCTGELGAPYVGRCRDTFDFHARCEPCACEHCYPFTYTDIADTNELFHLCVEDHCEACTIPPPDEDAGSEPADGGDPIEEQDAG